MTSSFYVITAVTFLLVGSAAGVYFDETKFEDLGHAGVAVTRVHHLKKRSTDTDNDVMPHELDVTVTTPMGDVSLRLRRNVEADAEVPVYTYRDGHFTKQKTNKLRKASFYQDRNLGASLHVRHVDENLQAFDLEGPLVINGTEYLITPASELVPLNDVSNTTHGRRAHKLKRLMKNIEYGTDYVDERTPEEKSQREERQRVRKLHRAERKQGRRSKRQAQVENTVEVVAVVDSSIWTKFFEMAQGNSSLAINEMRLYYIFIHNLMDIRYQSVTVIDPTLVIRVVIVALVVVEKRADSTWVESNRLSTLAIDDDATVDSFKLWVAQHKAELPPGDHYMAFTDYDLADSSTGSTSTVGIAYIGGLCNERHVSVIEDFFTGQTGAIAAHELGHNLDAQHDSRYRSCSDETHNVMASSSFFPAELNMASNPWRFSTCSVDAFGSYLDFTSCARTRAAPSLTAEVVLGQKYNADVQCQMSLGSDSYFCRTVQDRLGWELMCRRMYCYLPGQSGYCGVAVPHEYTSCDDGKWCELGVCVSNSSAPRTISECPQGDDPDYNCRTADCTDTRIRDGYCCRTCAERRGITIPTTTTTTNTTTTLAPAVAPASAAQTNIVQPTTAATTTTPTTTTTTRPTTTTTMTTAATTTTEGVGGCTTIACTCRFRWTLLCFFYYRG